MCSYVKYYHLEKNTSSKFEQISDVHQHFVHKILVVECHTLSP